MTFLKHLDHQLFFLINNGLGHDFLDSVFLGLSSLGGWTILIIAAALLSWRGRTVLLQHMLVLCVAGLLFTPVTSGLKTAIHRSRPEKAYAEQMKAGTVEIRILEQRIRNRSFPSGHSALAFFAMVYVALVRKPCRWWVLTLAAFVAFSRVYVGAHYPADCVAGAALGAAGGWVAYIAHKKFFPASSGREP